MDQTETKERRDSGSHDITSPKKLVSQYHGSVEVVRAGTLAALVENLTRHDKLDGSFNRTFFATYKYFTSGAELLELLIDRFDCSPPTLTAIQTTEWTTQTKPLIRLRVINVLKHWLEHFCHSQSAPRTPSGQAQHINFSQSFNADLRALIATEDRYHPSQPRQSQFCHEN
ncbi:cell division cycle- protein [Penicillium rubens]|nr:cell division cycle- protein [Penicillium rubens]